MNTVLWIAQGALAGLFLYAGILNLLAIRRHGMKPAGGPSFLCIGVAPGAAFAIGIAEIAGAIGAVLPWQTAEPFRLAQISAGGLALLMLAGCIHHARRKEHTAPIVGLIFLALFVIVGRMH